MGPGGTYALVTFVAGLLALLGWLYLTTENSRSGAMLKSSALIFALPIVFSPIDASILGMWLWVPCEEGLKAFASTREKRPANKFWLVALFGIWELALSKPLGGLTIAQSGEFWDRWALSALLYATVLPVLMHTVTAAIYAFVFEKRLWAAFIVSWIVHLSFNGAVDYFYPSVSAVIIETVVLGAILVGILPWQARKDGQPLSIQRIE